MTYFQGYYVKQATLLNRDELVIVDGKLILLVIKSISIFAMDWRIILMAYEVTVTTGAAPIGCV